MHVVDSVCKEGGMMKFELAAATLESVVPDTDRAYSVHQMARAWQAIGQPVAEDEIPLSVDPDDYLLF
jgi:hypothetical protein